MLAAEQAGDASRPEHKPRPAPGSWPWCWPGRARSCRRPRRSSGRSPTPTTWPCCRGSGPTCPAASTAAATPRCCGTCSARTRRQAVAADPRYTWLCRTLRAGELAGDGRQRRSWPRPSRRAAWTDAESIAAVLDHRAAADHPRHAAAGRRLGSPRARGCPSPARTGCWPRSGRAMDERTARLGQHVAETLPLWAERDLGPVPDDPAGRQDWLGPGRGRRGLPRDEGLATRPATRSGPRPASPTRSSARRGIPR